MGLYYIPAYTASITHVFSVRFDKGISAVKLRDGEKSVSLKRWKLVYVHGFGGGKGRVKQIRVKPGGCG